MSEKVQPTGSCVGWELWLWKLPLTLKDTWNLFLASKVILDSNLNKEMWSVPRTLGGGTHWFQMKTLAEWSPPCCSLEQWRTKEAGGRNSLVLSRPLLHLASSLAEEIHKIHSTGLGGFWGSENKQTFWDCPCNKERKISHLLPQCTKNTCTKVLATCAVS